MRTSIVLIMFLCSVCSADPLYNAFNNGELSPTMRYRLDTEQQFRGVETLENFLVKVQGVAMRRAGTIYVATVPTSDFNEIDRGDVNDAKIGISTAAQLQLITYDVAYPAGGDYELLNDIDCSGIANFDPIGGGHVDYDGSNPFIGTFDGRYYTISNIHILHSTGSLGGKLYNGKGLFGTIIGATIERVILENITHTNALHPTLPVFDRDIGSAGLLVGGVSIGGAGSGTIQDCFVQGSMVASGTGGISSSGGLFGGRIGGGYTIIRCGADITMSTVSAGIGLSGGFTGWHDGAGHTVIQDCYAIGTITGGGRFNSVGGFTGEHMYRTIAVIETTEFNNCYSAVEISGTQFYVPPAIGGFVGEINPAGDPAEIDGDYTSCFWDNDLIGTITGRAIDLFDCGNLASTNDEGDLVGVTKSTTTLMQTESTYTDESWDFTDETGVWYITAGNYPKHQWHRDATRLPREVEGNDIVRLIDFEFSTTDAYVIEAGNQYMRFYRDD